MEGYTDIEKKAHFLEIVNTFASQLLLCETIDNVLWLISKHAIAHINYEDCVVYWINKVSGLLEQRAAYGPKNPFEYDIANPITIEIGKGICGTVAKTGVAEIIQDTSKDPRYILDDEQRFSEITVPIAINGEVCGLIDSEHSRKGFYTQVDLDILTTVASMSSSRIVQIQYKNEISEHKSNLEKKVSEQTEKLQSYIEELEQKNAELEQNEKEKGILLKEIHHRVKNNLQIVSSLLNLQSHYLDDPKQRNAFVDCQMRIVSMAAIHEQLYSNGDLARIEMGSYLPDLVNKLKRSYDLTEKVDVFLGVDNIHLDIDNSVPVGLIITELFTNSIKHAFPNNVGKIHIEMRTSNEGHKIILSDNGIGFNVNTVKSSLGMTIIETLSQQLEAKIHTESSPNGTTTIITF